MRFDSLKSALSQCEGQQALDLSVFLRLCKDLMSDIEKSGNISINSCRLTEQELADSGFVGDLAWLGNLFSKIYENHQDLLGSQLGKVIQKRLSAAKENAQALERSIAQEKLDQEETARLEQMNQEKQKELEKLQKKAKDQAALEAKKELLLQEIEKIQAQLAALPPDSYLRKEEELNKLKEELQKKKQAQEEAEKAADREITEAKKAMEVLGQRLDEKEKERETQLQEKAGLQERVESQEAELKNLQDQQKELTQRLSETLKKYQEAEAVLAEAKTQEAANNDAYTKLLVEAAEQKERNERFEKIHIVPQEELLKEEQDKESKLKGQFEANRQELENLGAEIKNYQRLTKEAEETIETQKCSKAAVQELCHKKTNQLNVLKEEVDAAEKRRDELKGQEDQLITEKQRLDAEIMTRETQTIPTLKEAISALQEDSLKLQEEIKLFAEKKVLEEDKKEQLEKEYEQETDINERLEQRVGALSKEIQRLINDNNNLRAQLETQNPEETKKDLEEVKKQLEQKLKEVDENRMELMRKTEILKSQKKAVEDTAEEIAGLEKKINQAKEREEELLKEKERLTAESRIWEEKGIALDFLDKRCRFLSNTHRELAELERKFSRKTDDPTDDQIVEIGAGLDGIKAALVEYQKKIQESAKGFGDEKDAFFEQ